MLISTFSSATAMVEMQQIFSMVYTMFTQSLSRDKTILVLKYLANLINSFTLSVQSKIITDPWIEKLK